jgi:hypothetical protein
MKLPSMLPLLTLLAGCLIAAPIVMHNPKIEFVVWGNQDATVFENDWRKLLAAGVLDRLKEYGVESASVGPTLTALPDLQPAVFPEAWILDQFFSQITPEQGVAYVIVLPPGSGSTYSNQMGFAGYHFFGHGVPYAVVTPNEILISHEIYEMTTDPAMLGIHVSGLKEVGDVCEGRFVDFAGITVQQVWSFAKNQCL